MISGLINRLWFYYRHLFRFGAYKFIPMLVVIDIWIMVGNCCLFNFHILHELETFMENCWGNKRLWNLLLQFTNVGKVLRLLFYVWSHYYDSFICDIIKSAVCESSIKFNICTICTIFTLQMANLFCKVDFS